MTKWSISADTEERILLYIGPPPKKKDTADLIRLLKLFKLSILACEYLKRLNYPGQP